MCIRVLHLGFSIVSWLIWIEELGSGFWCVGIKNAIFLDFLDLVMNCFSGRRWLGFQGRSKTWEFNSIFNMRRVCESWPDCQSRKLSKILNQKSLKRSVGSFKSLFRGTGFLFSVGVQLVRYFIYKIKFFFDDLLLRQRPRQGSNGSNRR